MKFEIDESVLIIFVIGYVILRIVLGVWGH